MKETYSVRRALCALATLTLLGSAALPGAEHTYKFFRFAQTKLRVPSTTLIQVSEFTFSLGGSQIPTSGVIATNPGGNNPGTEGPEKIIDGLTNTKWLDFNKQPIVFEFPSAVTIDGYNFATANDAEARDPVSWIFSGSNDGSSWTPLHIVDDFPTTTARQTYQTGFTLPALAPPAISFFRIVPGAFGETKAIILNGESSEIEWEVSLADTLTLTGGSLNESVAAAGTRIIEPPDNEDTTYTLTATNAADTREAAVTVRTVEQGSAEFRYVRFTPAKLRDNAAANSVQIGEFLFLDNGTFLTPVAVTNPGGNNPTTEGPGNLIDGSPSSKWLDFNKLGVIFDFGAPARFDQYGMATANDASARDVVRWVLEGRNGESEAWTLIDNVTAFDFPTPVTRTTWTQDIPVPDSPGPYITPVVASAAALIEGQSLTIWYNTSNAASVSADNGIGALPLNGPFQITPSATTTYTLTATDDSGRTSSTAFTVQVLPTPAITTIAYQDFTGAGNELALISSAEITTDTTRPLPSATPRLRITPDLGSRNGSAWFRYRQQVDEGFEANFDIHVTSLGNGGADGMAFVIHNRPQGTQAHPLMTHENGLPSAALNIKFDSHQNGSAANGDLEISAAFIQVLAGSTVLATVDLATNPSISLRGNNLADMTDDTAQGAPYEVRVTYVPGDLDIWFEGVLVVENLNVDLGAIGAMDAAGTAVVGFTGRTGGLFEAHDVTRWFFSEGAPATDGNPLVLLAHSFDFTGDQLTLSWSSNAERTYRVTTSADLSSWNPVLSGIASGGGTTSTTVSFTQGAGGFFRVEEE